MGMGKFNDNGVSRDTTKEIPQPLKITFDQALKDLMVAAKREGLKVTIKVSDWSA